MRWLADNCGQFHSAAALAQISGVSVRTVKSEIAAIRQEINSSAVMEIDRGTFQGLPAFKFMIRSRPHSY